MSSRLEGFGFPWSRYTVYVSTVATMGAGCLGKLHSKRVKMKTTLETSEDEN
jgi:hypothetical protein